MSRPSCLFGASLAPCLAAMFSSLVAELCFVLGYGLLCLGLAPYDLFILTVETCCTAVRLVCCRLCAVR